MKNKIQSIVLCFLLNSASIAMTMEEESNIATALDLLQASREIKKSPSNSPREITQSSPRYQTESITTLLDEKQNDAQIIRSSQEKITSKYTQSTDKIQIPNIKFSAKNPFSVSTPYPGVFMQQNSDSSSYTITYNDRIDNPQTVIIPSKREYKNEPYAIINLGEKKYIVVDLSQAEKKETPTLIQLQESLASNETQTTQKPLSIEQQEGPSVGSFMCINCLNEPEKIYQGTTLTKIDNCYEITYSDHSNITHTTTFVPPLESSLSNDTTHIVIENLDKLITLPQSINLIFANWPPSSENPLYTCSTITKKEDGTYLITYTDNEGLTTEPRILNIPATENDLLNRYVTVLTKDLQPAFVIDLKSAKENSTDKNIEKAKEMLKEEIKDPDKNINYKKAFIGAGVVAAIIAILVYAYKYDKLPDIFYQFSGGLSNLLKKILPSGSTS